METSLHRELKKLYAGDNAQTEVVLDKYRKGDPTATKNPDADKAKISDIAK